MRLAASGKALQLLLSLAVIIALTAAPAGITVSTSDGLPAASAQPPPPGEPGGNHWTPGDNKKAIGVAKGRSWGESLAFGAVFGILGVISRRCDAQGKSK